MFTCWLLVKFDNCRKVWRSLWESIAPLSLLCLLGLFSPKLEVPDYFRLPSLIIMGNYVWGHSHSLSLCVIYFLRSACAFYSRLRIDSAWLVHFGGLLPDHHCTPPLEARQSLNHIIHILHTDKRQKLNISKTHTWYLSQAPRAYPCKFFLASVNFYRFNAKNWQFTV